MNIYAMRMKSGEEVIFRTELELSKLTQLTSQNELITVNKPVVMIPVENKVTFMPWIFFARDESFTITTEDVVLFYIPQDQIGSEYRKMTSGIVTPNSATPSLA